VSNSQVFKYENRLAGALVTRGGMSRVEAVQAAQAEIEEVREPTLAEIDAALQEIYALDARLEGGADPDALVRMYDCANRVLAMGAVFGLADLGKAAYSLCELVSRFQRLERFNAAMIRVHVDGLKLLRTPDEHPAKAREQVLAGLHQVTASVV
jgi:hypothetical protein